jgi:two-component sensor histidine kinase
MALLAFCGIVISLLVGRIESQQHRAIERLRMNEVIDNHFGSVTDHLIARENIATVVASLFNPPPLSMPRPLAQFGKKILSLAPDITSIGWLPEISAAQLDDALRAMAAAGIENPQIVGANGRPLNVKALNRPLYPIIDVVPDAAGHVIGTDIGDFPNRLATIRQAQRTRSIARTEATTLRQDPAALALLLYAPVFADNGHFLGVIGFGYKIDDLLRSAMGPRRDLPFSVSVVSPDTKQTLARFPDSDSGNGGVTAIERRTKFAGHDLIFVYAFPRDLSRLGFWRGLWVALVGFSLTGAALLLLGFMSSRATALANEVASRRSAEDRLKVVIHELNHRVRNVMTVAQAVVRLSFTSGYNLADVQKTCEGRLQALANAMTLLTASDWRSVSLRQLISEDIIPFSDRITADGPDISLRPRAAQTFALLLYELTTNAAKHGALSVPEGQVFLDWTIDDASEEPQFRLTWRETGGPEVATPTRRGFGELLVRRIAPRDVAGRSTVSYDSKGFRYELEAPLKELLEPPAKAS